MQPDRDSVRPAGLIVQVLTPTGRDAELICELLQREAMDCRRCDSLAALLAQLSGTATGTAIVAEEALSPEGTRQLLAALERQPGWSDLPVVILTQRSGPQKHAAALMVRASANLLTRPVEAATLLTTVRAALEARRRQYQIRDMLSELRSLNEQLDRRAGQLQQLALQLTQAEEAERRRLAVILHEDVQQLLAGVNFRLDTLPHHADDPHALREIVKEIQDTLRRAIKKSRGLSHELSPPILRQTELDTALEWLADQMQDIHQLTVDFEAEPGAEPQDDSLVIFLFRAVQELLFNTRRHAGTDRATVRMRRVGEEVEVTVEDEGRGFDPSLLETRQGLSTGFGLFSIRERIALLGGRMEVRSAPGMGSRFRLVVPYRAAPASNEQANRQNSANSQG